MRRCIAGVALVFVAAMMVMTMGCESSSSGSGTGNIEDYQGALSGTWSGSGLSGTWRANISATGVVTGSFTGDDAGSIRGNVTADGTFEASAKGAAGVAVWTGELGSNGSNVVSGSGSWSAASTGNSGSWSS